MPDLVRVLTTACDAWVVGGAALPDATVVKDWDVLVPFTKWGHAALILKGFPLNLNTFGGFKVVQAGVIIDVWPGDLGDLMARGGFSKAAWHPTSGVRLVRV